MKLLKSIFRLKMFPALRWWVNLLPWALLALSLQGSLVITSVVSDALGNWAFLPVLLSTLTLALFVSFCIPSDCQSCCEQLGCFGCILLGCGCAMC